MRRSIFVSTILKNTKKYHIDNYGTIKYNKGTKTVMIKYRKGFNIIMEKYYSAKEAAEEFNLSEKTLKDWLRAGKIKGEKVGRSWKIAESVLRDYLKLPYSDNRIQSESDLRYELLDIQIKLFNIEKYGYGGISRSKALRWAAMIEEIIGEILDDQEYDDEGNCTISGIGGGKPKDNAVILGLKPKNDISSRQFSISHLINNIVSELIDRPNVFDGNSLLQSIDLIQNSINMFNEDDNKRNPITSKLGRHVEQLRANCKRNLNKKEKRGGWIFEEDGYWIAFEFRKFEEYLPPDIKSLKIEALAKNDIKANKDI